MQSFVKKSVLKLEAYVPGEQPTAKNVVKLNTNENPYPPSSRVAKALAAVSVDQLRLYPDPLAKKLRSAIAALHNCGPENVFVGNGSDEVLALCSRAFVEDKGSIGFFVPSYSLYPVLTNMRNVKAKPVQLARDFGWAMPAGYKCSLFYLANPNAPTSIMYDKETVRSFCGKLKGVVLIDEAYADFADDNCADLALSMPNVLICRTCSKAYSLAGIRLGYAVGPVPLINALFKLKDSYNTNVLTQAIALAGIFDSTHMRRNVRVIRNTRRRLTIQLRKRGFEVAPSQTNFLWVKPPSIPARTLFERLRDKHILVRYFQGPRTGSHLRITIGSDVQVDILLKAIDDIMKKAGSLSGGRL